MLFPAADTVPIWDAKSFPGSMRHPFPQQLCLPRDLRTNVVATTEPPGFLKRANRVTRTPQPTWFNKAQHLPPTWWGNVDSSRWLTMPLTTRPQSSKGTSLCPWSWPWLPQAGRPHAGSSAHDRGRLPLLRARVRPAARPLSAPASLPLSNSARFPSLGAARPCKQGCGWSNLSQCFPRRRPRGVHRCSPRLEIPRGRALSILFSI